MERSTIPSLAREAEPLPWAGLAHLLVIYLVWGSTYLAIRIAVREGAGFPPFTMSALRVVAAGSVLLLWAALTRQRLALSRYEVMVLASAGALLWVGGNGLVVWAEQRAHSGYAALLVSSTPIWVASMEAVLDRQSPSPLLIGSLLVGLLGVGVLSGPALATAGSADISSVLALVLASVSWSVGSLLQRRRPVQAGPLVSSGYQHLFGGLGFVLLVVLAGEPIPTPTTEAWLAWGYLVVFGSLLAFTSFVHVLRLLPTNLAMTYSYVNPAIAVILGWLILSEPITPWTVAGMALVLMGVAGVFQERYRR